jgi:HAE1 family hydrophobic/amphiphilic exporter-1
LWIASGAGGIARQIIGTTVIGGMVAETFIGRFFVPAIYVAVERLAGAKLAAGGIEPSPAPGD